MDSFSYFSEREEGLRPPTVDYISDQIWGGIRALIHARINDGSFGAKYPTMCPDGYGPVGTDDSQFVDSLLAEVPNVEPEDLFRDFEGVWQQNDLFDTIEFCWNCIGEPTKGTYHSFFQHHHLTFDIDAGRENFREDINRIFRRNGLVYELSQEGRIQRLVPPVLHKSLLSPQFRTGDSELDNLLESAQNKFLDSDQAIHYEALKDLWDAWERLKTIVSGTHKRIQVEIILDQTAGSRSPQFRESLEKEAKELTSIGNRFHIRHSETDQERLVDNSHIDYLFLRLFALIQLIIRRCS